MYRTLLPCLLLVLLACPAAAWDELLVLTTDYTTYGGVTVVDRSAPWTADLDVETILADAVARWHDGLVYVVNRAGANIQVLDPAAGYATLRQFSVGAGRNPQDIAFVGGRAFVSCYDAALLLEVDTAAGAVIDSWSTAPFADADGLPETAWMHVHGRRIFLTCQRLDRNHYWGPADYSQLLVFDTDLDAWVDVDPVAPGVNGLVLTGTNPAPQPQPVPGGGLAVATVGAFAVLDGGLEIVDLDALTTSPLLTTESDMLGEIVDFAMVDATHYWAAVSTPSFRTMLQVGTLGSSIMVKETSAGYDFVDVAFDGADQVFLCDRSLGAAGLRVFDAHTGVELTAAPIATGRPPVLVLLPVDTTTAAAALPPAALTLSAPWPNPANPRVSLRVAAPAGSALRLSVVDLRGRVVRAETADVGETGELVWRFDGCDGSGRPLASGQYRLVARGAGVRAARAFTLAR
jgi:hypothetical protein